MGGAHACPQCRPDPVHGRGVRRQVFGRGDGGGRRCREWSGGQTRAAPQATPPGDRRRCVPRRATAAADRRPGSSRAPSRRTPRARSPAAAGGLRCRDGGCGTRGSCPGRRRRRCRRAIRRPAGRGRGCRRPRRRRRRRGPVPSAAVRGSGTSVPEGPSAGRRPRPRRGRSRGAPARGCRAPAGHGPRRSRGSARPPPRPGSIPRGGGVGGEHGQVRVVDRDPVRREGRVAVTADADDRDRAAPGRAQGVSEPVRPVVGAVVVGHRHHVDTRPVQQVERRWRCPEPVAVGGNLELLRVPGTPGRERTLQVDHGEVGAPQCPRDRSQRTAGAVQQRGEVQLEVHVPGEAQRHHARGLVGGGRARRGGCRWRRRHGLAAHAAGGREDGRQGEQGGGAAAAHPRPATGCCNSSSSRV